MVKRSFLVLTCFVGLIIFVPSLYGKGLKKTITLPSGEVVCDLNGEWDAFIENYGHWDNFGKYPRVIKITQQGGSFVGIMMSEDVHVPKGNEAIRGELDKKGFKKVQLMTHVGPLDANGQISDDGNLIIIDVGDRLRETYIRK